MVTAKLICVFVHSVSHMQKAGFLTMRLTCSYQDLIETIFYIIDLGKEQKGAGQSARMLLLIRAFDIFIGLK